VSHYFVMWDGLLWPKTCAAGFSFAGGIYEGRPPTHGYAATREAAVAAFAKSWRREWSPWKSPAPVLGRAGL